MTHTSCGQLHPWDITSLSDDVLLNWNSSYSLEHFRPCKSFGGDRVNPSSNRQIFSSKFDKVPLIKDLIELFKPIYPNLEIGMVWLIRKSPSEEGFQRWHQDMESTLFYTNTIVINIGSDTTQLKRKSMHRMSTNEEIGIAASHNEDMAHTATVDDLRKERGDGGNTEWVGCQLKVKVRVDSTMMKGSLWAMFIKEYSTIQSCCYHTFLMDNAHLIPLVREIFDCLFLNPTHPPTEHGEGIVLSADSTYGNQPTINIHRKSSYLRQNFGKDNGEINSVDRSTVFRFVYGTGCGIQTHGIPKW